jgi:crossover junction endodeoxyribonuclease RusA
MQIKLDIYGDPAPQGSKRIIHGRLVEASSEKLRRWRKAIAAECAAAKGDSNIFFTGPVRVEVVFFMPRPKSVKESVRPWPIVPPDLDKLCRGLLDGIGQSEVIWGDDSQVVVLLADKVYADNREPGATVNITGM